MRLSRLLLTLLLAPLLAAAASASPAEPPVPLLWKVSGAEGSLYLLGSFHMLKPGDYPLSPDVDAAFDDAEALLFEMSPAEMASPALALEMGRAALRGDGTTLDGELPPELREAFGDWTARNDTLLREQGMAPEMLQMFEPWFIALTVNMLDMTQAGFVAELGLDQHLAGAAEAAGKPAGGLETARQQIEFLDGMERTEQLQYLADALESARGGNEELAQLHAAWREGDPERVWGLVGEEMKSRYPELYRHINVQRNDAWLPQLEARLAAPGADDTLVVVGALHLLGEDGLVEKLGARGYRVERICSACAAP